MKKVPQKYFIEYTSKYKSHRVDMRSVFVLTDMVNISRADVKETRPGRDLFGAREMQSGHEMSGSGGGQI